MPYDEQIHKQSDSQLIRSENIKCSDNNTAWAPITAFKLHLYEMNVLGLMIEPIVQNFISWDDKIIIIVM